MIRFRWWRYRRANRRFAASASRAGTAIRHYTAAYQALPEDVKQAMRVPPSAKGDPE